MSNAVVMAIPWMVLALHLAIGIVARRGVTDRPLVPLLNLCVALVVLAWWARRWYGYLFRHVTWYASDQVVPLYALLVCVLVAATLSGRYRGSALHWIVFGVDAAVMLAAGLFFSFVRINRMI